MAGTEFMRVRLSGGRFKEAELPFFILGDLVSLQDLVIDVAKWSFREKHGRKRTTSDFGKVYLKLVGLHPGSTVIEIEIGTTQMILEGVPVPNQEHFNTASNSIVETIRSAEQGAEHLNGLIPPEYMPQFNHVGYSLRGNEVMEITAANNHKADLTPQTHKVLVYHSSATIMRDITIRGVISEVDRKAMKFRLDPIHGQAARCPFLGQHKDVVLEALSRYKSQDDYDKVEVHATGVYNKQNKLQKVEYVKNVELLDSLDVGARLDEFRNLQDDWLEDGGVAPSHDGLDWLLDVFEQYYPAGLPLPRTYPTADGGVSLEWSLGGREIDIEIDLENHTGEWHMFDKSAKSSENVKELDLDKLEHWKWVSKQLQDLME